MLLQTHAYSVPRDKQDQHARLMRRLQEEMRRLGGSVEVYEQVGPDFKPEEATGRFVQILRFRDRRHLQQVQAAERTDANCQALIAEFVALIDLAGQQASGQFVPGYYASVTPAERTPPTSMSTDPGSPSAGPSTGA